MPTRQRIVTLWHYRCPECGFGDGDTGYLAAHEAIYCEVCLEDGRQARLQRWEREEE